jgi:hypothetical protein
MIRQGDGEFAKPHEEINERVVGMSSSPYYSKKRREVDMDQQNKKRKWAVITGLTVLLAVTGVAYAGSLEPSAAPGPTMRTLDQIPPTWDQILPSSTRFQLVMGGAAVLDKETGLVWEQSPSTNLNVWGTVHCNLLTVDNRKGWRFPTIQELASLVDASVSSPGPALPNGHPFSNVQSYYWSATPDMFGSSTVWAVNFSTGGVISIDKSSSAYFWCVRGGQGVDLP